ncbi:cytochrome c oxidase assembly protein [Cavenderia fasciculata]|uniref:Cytochrome c oxidase assembly protein n=1 Tax=Cavenderia fasciculata TaxID=261658 RepID=F4PLZ2_CACFS|nr:cytochrome c oxidase assembly protein [Cavenderia fasciculata]EGG23546.1 cytochrome c oxidase assembly protein [Cavenderia fasciculata]|eukprot:XP_004361397.1 cytochrome c oxidase assembly protein [Cavenderia fasciculata]
MILGRSSKRLLTTINLNNGNIINNQRLSNVAAVAGQRFITTSNNRHSSQSSSLPLSLFSNNRSNNNNSLITFSSPTLKPSSSSLFTNKRFYTTSEQKQDEKKQEEQQQQEEEETVKQDDIGKKRVARWLLFSAGLVGAMVVVGGITRLTESGLSMVEWKPIVGAVPPITQEQWEQEFEKYKQFPEYQKLNKGMTLEEFKQIFFWEYSHRLMGRMIGVAFFFPFVHYWRKGYIDRSLAKKLSAIFLLGGAQGALGWYMVKSGLDEKLIIGEVPRVSQYRLAAHLGSAFVIYSALLWIGLDLASPAKLTESARQRLSQYSHQLTALRRFTPITASLIFVTAMSGAFVAGLDAGLVHNTFPTMNNGQWIPDDLIDPKIQPKWLNMFEHDVMAQFDHRLLATTTYVSVLTLAALASRGRGGLTRRARLAFNSLAVMATVQVGLGIATLLTFVPVSLGASHQAGSLSLLSIAIWCVHEMKKLPK